VLEVGDRAEHGSFESFRAHIRAGHIDDALDGDVRRVRYATGARLLETAVDLRANRMLERRVDGRVYDPPMLSSPSAAQSRSGPIRIGAATLSAEGAPAWLAGDDAAECWAAANPSDAAVPLRLETPAATVESAAFGFGRIVVQGGARPQLDVLAVRQLAPLVVRCAHAPRVVWNGQDVSAAVRRVGDAWALPVQARGEA
jgi:hypothetical protein